MASSPLATHYRLSTNQGPYLNEEKEEMERVPYVSVVASLIYIMINTRPDKAYTVGIVCR